MLKIVLEACLLFVFSSILFADELRDLSADAVCEFQALHGVSSSPDFNLDEKASVNKEFLLKGESSDPKQVCAFKTRRGKGEGGWPYIIIRLAKESDIKKIYIQNRLDENKKWASGLAVWISKDQNVWKRVWEAKKVEDEWTIELPKPETGKFIMIAIDREVATLSLNKVRIYGNPR